MHRAGRFSENYVCHYLGEISSAYYSKERVTVHPAMIHYKGVNGELKHMSFVVLSDEMAHTVATVFAFLKAIVGWIKQNLAHVQHIHYLSHSVQERYYLEPSVTAQGHVRHICVMAVL